MASGPRRDRNELKSEINVTPLVDVVLVLLIIFMVITPLLTRGRNVQLPMASAVDDAADARDSVVLTVGADKRLWLERQEVTYETLAEALRARLANRPASQVLIKADVSVSVRDLRPVLQRLKAAKIRQIAFAVLEPRSGP